MANIFQGESKVARCVREWDRLLREREWVDTEIFASIFSYDTISGEEMFGYEKAVKKAKKEIRLALQERGMLLREQADAQDNRRLLTAYPLDNKDPLHNLRIMAVVEDAMAFSRALQITYSPSFHETEEHIFHPQYLRNYNGRPYVYGVYENEEENNGFPFVALPVDRIVRRNYATYSVPLLISVIRKCWRWSSVRTTRRCTNYFFPNRFTIVSVSSSRVLPSRPDSSQCACK